MSKAMVLHSPHIMVKTTVSEFKKVDFEKICWTANDAMKDMTDSLP